MTYLNFRPLEVNNAVAHPTSANRSKLASKAAAAAAASSHKVTDYFKVRRSGRRPKKTLEKEQLEDYEVGRAWFVMALTFIQASG